MCNSEGKNVGQIEIIRLIIKLHSVFQVSHCIGLPLFDNGKGDNECGTTLPATQ